jgi:aldose 1-epimerase
MSNPTVFRGDYRGEPAVWLKAGPYEAAVLPEIGANLIALRHTERGCQLLHEPAEGEMDAFKARPITCGIPVLFPPNRYEDGKFTWNGRTYEFPVNEPNRGNHLHGFLHNIPWTAETMAANAEQSRVTLVQHVTEGHPVFTYWPHSFTMRLTYVLSADGLEQHVWIRNDGDAAMPCMLGFHTAVNAPFAPDGRAEDCRVQLSIGGRWELDERMLPTGRMQALSPKEQDLKLRGVYPFFEALDNHYTAEPVNGRNGMVLTDARADASLIYDVDTAYKMWMIWNNNATEGFFCPEPQVNLVNAPNVAGLSDEEKGFVALAPGEVWEASSRMYVQFGRPA